MTCKRLTVLLWIQLFACLCLSTATAEHHETADDEGWIELFNHKNLDGWTPKFTHHELGVNYKDTFGVEDGKLIIDYSNWEKWDASFGHLFYKDKFSHYRILVEYRFVGEQVADGPGWALRNNGVMMHCQSAESMGLNQEFPDSMEGQILGGDGTHDRTTGNLCTPGTHVVMEGELNTNHCINSSSRTFHGDQWVIFEAEVHGGGAIKHFINGELVLEYEKPQLNDGTILTEGYISIQAESHPTEFRRIAIKPLDEEE